jgi:hypothetical protein
MSRRDPTAASTVTGRGRPARPCMTATMRAALLCVACVIVGVAPDAQRSSALEEEEARVSLRVVELGSRPKQPIGSATVRLLDQRGNVLAAGITATDGTFEAAVRAPDPLIVEWSKTGYVRNPERITVKGGAQSVDREVDLIRRSADDAYFHAVAEDIKRKADAAGPANATAAYKEQSVRVGELPAAAQRTLSSKLQQIGGPKDIRRLEAPSKKEREALERRATQEKSDARDDKSQPKGDKAQAKDDKAQSKDDKPQVKDERAQPREDKPKTKDDKPELKDHPQTQERLRIQERHR